MFFQQAGTLLVRHDALDIFAEHADALDVLAALRNDDVGIALCGLYKLLVHGLEHLKVTVNDHRHGSATVNGVALNVADETFVRVAVDKDFKIHHLTQLLVEQRHDTLNDDYGLRLHMYGLGQAIAEKIRIGGLLYCLAVAQSVDLLDEQFPVERIGVVKVDGMTLLIGHV